MAKSSKRNRKLFKEYSNLEVFVVVLLVVTLGAITWLFSSMSREISRYTALSNQSNQACVGLSIATTSGLNFDTKTIQATSELKNGSTNDPTANQKCLTAGTTVAETIQTKKVPAYSFGADVTYFKDSQSAKDYADNNLNPLRYWSPDPSNTYYTFLVTHHKQAYFDSYSVKGNAVMRISLPCDDSEITDLSLKTCQLQAERTISLFNKRLSLLKL